MRAVSQGTLRRDPYCRLHPELPKRKSRHMKLEDLKTLMTTPVEKPQLQFVRDMFIFSTFTGLAYADLKRLSDKDITQTGDGTWWIHIHRKKTDTLSSVRLLDIPLQIIEKYRGQRSGDKVFNIYARSYFHHADLRAGYGHESGRGHETVEVHRFRKQDRPLRGGFHRQEKAENKITGCMKWKTEKLPG